MYLIKIQKQPYFNFGNNSFWIPYKKKIQKFFNRIGSSFHVTWSSCCLFLWGQICTFWFHLDGPPGPPNEFRRIFFFTKDREWGGLSNAGINFTQNPRKTKGWAFLTRREVSNKAEGYFDVFFYENNIRLRKKIYPKHFVISCLNLVKKKFGNVDFKGSNFWK